jgi:hypothetical protein
MFKENTPKPSSANQAEFVADFYERMLEEGQGDGVTRFSDDILFLIIVFDDSLCASSPAQWSARPALAS